MDKCKHYRRYYLSVKPGLSQVNIVNIGKRTTSTTNGGAHTVHSLSKLELDLMKLRNEEKELNNPIFTVVPDCPFSLLECNGDETNKWGLLIRTRLKSNKTQGEGAFSMSEDNRECQLTAGSVGALWILAEWIYYIVWQATLAVPVRLVLWLLLAR